MRYVDLQGDFRSQAENDGRVVGFDARFDHLQVGRQVETGSDLGPIEAFDALHIIDGHERVEQIFKIAAEPTVEVSDAYGILRPTAVQALSLQLKVGHPFEGVVIGIGDAAGEDQTEIPLFVAAIGPKLLFQHVSEAPGLACFGGDDPLAGDDGPIERIQGREIATGPGAEKGVRTGSTTATGEESPEAQ